MLKLLYSSLLLALISISYAQQKMEVKIQHFPDYETVVNHFYDNYWPNNSISPDIQIEFARKPNGYFIVLKNFVTPSKTKDYLIWNRWGYNKPKNFIKRNVNTDTSLHDYQQYQNREAQLTPYLIRSFNIHTFYGYRGWADDIVKHLEPKRNKLNDDDLYSLGRAYAAISAGLMHHYEDATLLNVKQKDLHFDASKPQNNLSENQLEYYLQLQQKAQSCFKQLADRSPRFSTIVGKIQTKYANEVVQSYLDLWMYQNEEIATKMLIPKIYPPEVLANARNYLRNCSVYAILFTNGDNDTYPLWYIQATENFRTDVSVVNLSLLWKPKYIEAIKRGMNGVIVNLNLPHKYYEDVQFLTFDAEKELVSGEDFLKWVEAQTPSQTLQSSFSEVYFYCPRKPTETIKGDFSQRLFKPYLAVLDMYYSNGRTIEFSQEEGGPTFFNGHFVLRGMVSGIDMCSDYKVDHNAFFDFLQTIETEEYLNPKNYPMRLDESTPVDDFFVQKLYQNTLIALKDAIEREDEERINFYKVHFQNMIDHWAVPPEPYLLELFEQLGGG